MVQAHFIVEAKDIAELEKPEHIIYFFTRLGYTTDIERNETSSKVLLKRLHERTTLQDKIAEVTHIARQQDETSVLDIYLYKLPRLTRTLRNEIIKDIKQLRENCLLILADPDFHQLEFIYVDRQATNNQGKNLRIDSIWGDLLDDLLDSPTEPLIRVQRVDRRHPSQVIVTMLRALCLQTSHVLAQCKYLSIAFDAAETRELYFNNRSLFSNYYLQDRLPGESEWQNEVQSERAAVLSQVYSRLHRLYASGAGELYAGLRKPELRAELFEPVLKELGFIVSSPSAKAEHDYLFTITQQDGSETKIVCQVYPWGRLLDDPLTFLAPEEAERDENPAENPAVTLVAQLQETGAQWGILTNGKLWRLYSAKAQSRSTNYYEIDLEENFSIARKQADAAITAFLYFWLFFRRVAFVVKPAPTYTTPLSFLDNVMLGSQLYARDLSDSLKERVFDQIFPKLAQGFVDYALATGLLRSDLLRLPEEARNRELEPYFAGTLDFLFRLLFLLYAESRELLPVHDERYNKQSLKTLKQEISQAAGDYLGDARETGIQQEYKASKDDCRLYDRLWRLFVAIDQGDPSLNVPAYHGDIFLTEPPEDKTLAEMNEDEQIAYFLKTHKIPDQYLALGLDLLTRDVDPVKKDSTQKDADKLYIIDYRNLGVRQLGSIYEGLLEFKLRIAAQPMLVVDNKVLPADSHASPTYTLGQVYIENDLHERKATGSYYTPDYIVKYIIAETIGPILQELLDKQRNSTLRINLDAYHGRIQQEKRNRRTRELDEATYQRIAATSQSFVEEFFNLKVLDPSMGSGHFLVDAVDYITDYMVERLRIWKPTPLDVSLNNIRASIQAEAEARGISLDPSLLSEINLLKRQVLKRCIFGVDLNPMAVRLAKLSLWIDSLTQGAPFSFLNHHLRCGNSLLGATLHFIGQATQDLWGYQLDAILASVRGFELISRNADENAQVLEESRAQFVESSARLLPLQHFSNLWLSQAYGNEGAREAVAYHKAAIFDGKVTPDLQVSIKDPTKPRSLKFGDKQEKQVKVLDLLTFAQALAAREGGRNFFNWDLEFPEVFFDKSGQRPNRTRGFDAIIGNPPYVRQEGLGADKEAFSDIYKPIFSSSADLYTYFIIRAHELLHDNARFGMITSNKFMRANYGAGLRAFLANGEQVSLEKLVDFGDLPVFGDATTYPIIILSCKTPRNSAPIAYGRIKDLTFLQSDSGVATLDESAQSALNPMPESAFSNSGWSLADVNAQAILDKLQKNSLRLEKWLPTKIEYGIKTGYNEAFVIDQQTRDQLIAADSKSADIIKPFLVGEDIHKYSVNYQNRYLIWTYIGVPIERYPAIYQYLSRNQERLEKRGDKGKHWWELRHCDYYADFEKPKIIFPDIANGCRFAFSRAGEFSGNTTYLFVSQDLFLLSLLNSSLIEFFYRSNTAVYRGGYLRFFTQYIIETPIRRIKFTTPKYEYAYLNKQSQQIYQRYLETGRRKEMLDFTKQLLAREVEAADVVHDTLVMLAESMLKLNARRQTVEGAFLGFIENAFNVQPQPDPKSGKVGIDALTNKTTLFEFAGDYQKGTLLKPLPELVKVLEKNRKRCVIFGDSFRQASIDLAAQYE